MRRILISLFSILISTVAIAQIDFSEDWYNSNWEMASNESAIIDVSSNVINGNDLSYLLQMPYPNSYNIDKPAPFYGVFGRNYNKIELFFSGVAQSQKDSSVYIITGKSKLVNNVCDFMGSIKLDKATAYCKPNDDTVVVLVGSYELHEYPKEIGNGVFKGKLKISLWPKNLFSDSVEFDLEAVYEQGAVKGFVGIWEEFYSTAKYKCIWGFERFPSKYTGDFDLGAGEMVINIKYARTWFNYSNSEWQEIEKKETDGMNIHFHKYIHPKDATWFKE